MIQTSDVIDKGSGQAHTCNKRNLIAGTKQSSLQLLWFSHLLRMSVQSAQLSVLSAVS